MQGIDSALVYTGSLRNKMTLTNSHHVIFRPLLWRKEDWKYIEVSNCSVSISMGSVNMVHKCMWMKLPKYWKALFYIINILQSHTSKNKPYNLTIWRWRDVSWPAIYQYTKKEMDCIHNILVKIASSSILVDE